MKQNSNSFIPQSLAITTVLALLLLLGPSRPLEAIEADTVYPSDPAFSTAPTEPGFPPRLKTLWLEALGRPEIDNKRQAADTIALAKGLGMTNLEDAAPRLLAELEAPKANPIVKLAAARALIGLPTSQPQAR